MRGSAEIGSAAMDMNEPNSVSTGSIVNGPVGLAPIPHVSTGLPEALGRLHANRGAPAPCIAMASARTDAEVVSTFWTLQPIPWCNAYLTTDGVPCFTQATAGSFVTGLIASAIG